jgi:hypothetical protein
MPSAFSHAFIALPLGKTFFEREMPLRFWLLAVLCSILPDVDVYSFYFRTGAGGLFWHRGFTHSLLFAFLLSSAAVWVGFREGDASFLAAGLFPRRFGCLDRKGLWGRLFLALRYDPLFLSLGPHKNLTHRPEILFQPMGKGSDPERGPMGLDSFGFAVSCGPGIQVAEVPGFSPDGQRI